ncbi:MAG: 2-C-methyl-D-erythritol 4-phosphate cytidylyltransferase [Deltaproteobacteria bacterium]|nr:2-C-methyl-D-erythritol 4-phosphate cytidylyltransferase [Deltaproteobacteria bacterium]
MDIQAIIPSAGQGRRFGALKQFLDLEGKPLLCHALESFLKSPLITGLCLVVPEPEMEQAREIVDSFSTKKQIKIIAGGATRQDSVARGFDALKPCDLVVIHDGVRPLISTTLIEDVISAARESGASVAGLPVKETTKEVSKEMFVTKTVDRNQLWSIQTPQAFRYPLLKKGFEQAKRDNFTGTDEAMLVERIGAKVKVVEGDPYNIKVTRPQDLEMAKKLLVLRRAKS